MKSAFLLRPLGLIPDPLHALVVATVLNCPVKSSAARTRVAELNGKRIGLKILDTGITVHLLVAGGRFHPDSDGTPDATICGRAIDLLRLMLALEDPDALFFSRRLALEGDVEVALHTRNVLDAIGYDWNACIGRIAGPRAAETVIGLFRASRIGPLLMRILSAHD
ncbi:MAG: ubiquinone anaerobic biosynthesis accessory factor UbiT [Acidiferrobacteraceae bacterium]